MEVLKEMKLYSLWDHLTREQLTAESSALNNLYGRTSDNFSRNRSSGDGYFHKHNNTNPPINTTHIQC